MAGAPWDNAPTVLILGGSGGVGHVAIQIARAMGAGKVITTCSPRNFEFVTSLGADETIDYHTMDFWSDEAGLKDSVDFVLDAVGEPGTGNNAMQVLKDNGHYLTLLGKLATPPKPTVSQAMCSVSETGTEQLDTLKGLVDEGKLKILIEHTYTMDDVEQAMEASKDGHTTGKIAITIA
mmetsp:Transcript_65018/g.89874  ORF Transcript_65018/g.89874 Transcript_65018/m.89874 type:complete len:179 (-) Transcript_65018:54-590(-)